MNHYQTDNNTYDTSNDQALPFPHPAFMTSTNLPAPSHQYNADSYRPAQENLNTHEYSSNQLTAPQQFENLVWFKPQYYSKRSISLQVGNNYHEIFVYTDDSAKNELVVNSLTNDCNFKTSSPYCMYSTLNGMRFRSLGEVCIYFALKETGSLFHANSSITAGEQRKEPDFTLIYKGKVYILDVLNNETHNSEKDAKNTRFYQNYGVPLRSYTSEECVNYPQWVVQDFLNWVQQQS